MRTELQNQRRRAREAARARAQADRNYRHVGYLDALLHASSHCPYQQGTEAAKAWREGYEAGRDGQRQISEAREGVDL